MKNIVELEDSQLVVTLKDIATYSGTKEKSIKRLLVDNEDMFEELGLKVKESKAILNRLSELKLNEEQTTFLFVLMRNSPQVVEFKFNLVKQFMKLKDAVCETNKMQLEQKDIQLEISQKQLKEAKRKIHAYPRGNGFETVTRIIKDYGVNITAHDLNEHLANVGLLETEIVEVKNYKSSKMSGIVPLVHVDTVVTLLDKLGYERGLAYADVHPTLFEEM